MSNSTPRNNIVVMKFGGTSVEDATAILRTASIVASRLRRNLNPIVVVSAMSKVTDTLLAAAAAAGRNEREEALKLSDSLRTRHLNTAAELVTEQRPPHLPPAQHPSRLRHPRRPPPRHLRRRRTHARAPPTT